MFLRTSPIVEMNPRPEAIGSPEVVPERGIEPRTY